MQQIFSIGGSIEGGCKGSPCIKAMLNLCTIKTNIDRIDLPIIDLQPTFCCTSHPLATSWRYAGRHIPGAPHLLDRGVRVFCSNPIIKIINYKLIIARRQITWARVNRPPVQPGRCTKVGSARLIWCPVAAHIWCPHRDWMNHAIPVCERETIRTTTTLRKVPVVFFCSRCLCCCTLVQHCDHDLPPTFAGARLLRKKCVLNYVYFGKRVRWQPAAEHVAAERIGMED